MKKTSVYILILGIAFSIFITIIFFTKDNVDKTRSIELMQKEINLFNWVPLVSYVLVVIGLIILQQSDKWHSKK